MSAASDTHGIVTASVVPVRASGAHRAERVTDVVLGEVVAVLDQRDDWLLARGADGYEGWIPSGRIRRVSSAEAEAWQARATLYSTGTPYDVEGGLARIPWGARVIPGGGGFVDLPDERRVRPRDPRRLVDFPHVEAQRHAGIDDRSSLTRAALDWLDVPYAWGGRTELGVDCSGFVQALYGRYGIRLPRDSHAQHDVGPAVEVGSPTAAGTGEEGQGHPEPGDLLFFAPEGRGVTHVGLVLDGWRILHAASSNGRVTTDDLAGAGPLARRLAGSIAGCTRPFAPVAGD
jgi:hypothetical protein